MALGQLLELEVEGSAEPIRVRYSAIDLRRYESQFHKSVLVEPMSLTMLTYLGWSAAKRTGLLNGSYDKWDAFDAACVNVRTIRDETDADPPTSGEATPTPTAPTDG